MAWHTCQILVRSTKRPGIQIVSLVSLCFYPCFSGLILVVISEYISAMQITRSQDHLLQHGDMNVLSQTSSALWVETPSESAWFMPVSFVKHLIALTWQAVAYLWWEDINQRDSCFSALWYRRFYAKSHDWGSRGSTRDLQCSKSIVPFYFTQTQVVDRKETDGILRMHLNRLKLFSDTSSFHCWRAILPQTMIVVRYWRQPKVPRRRRWPNDPLSLDQENTTWPKGHYAQRTLQ